MIITEPRWKSLIVETTTPLFTPEQCQLIIKAGQSQPKEEGQPQSIEELEELIANLDDSVPAEERQRLKKKLKKKKQQKAKKENTQ